MKQLQRIFCLVLCICVFGTILAGSVLSVMGCHHSCQGDDCAICSEASAWRRNLAASFVCRATGLCNQLLRSFGGLSAVVEQVSATDTLLALGVMLTI